MTCYLRFFFLCGIVMLMTACATSTKSTLYTLSKPFETQTISEYTGTVAPVNELVSVLISVPNRLRRPQLVLNTQGGTEVVMLEHNRWASSFDEELHDAVVSGIHQALKADLNSQTNQAYYRVDVSLLAIDTLLDDHVQANFRWAITQQESVSKITNTDKLSCDFNSYQSAADGIQGVVKSTQKIVQALVNDIVERMIMMRAGGSVDCK